MLIKSTPYMLRRDGTLFICRGDHPYVIYNPEDSLRAEVQDLFMIRTDDINWFYSHTADRQFKQDTEVLVYNFLIRYESDIEDDLEIPSEQDPSMQRTDEEFYALYKEIDRKANSEFLRVLISADSPDGNSKDIHFRVSSKGFNWFALIMNMVCENRKSIATVTIETDIRSGRSAEILQAEGITFDHLSADEFISLSGSGSPLTETLAEQPEDDSGEGGFW